MDEILKRLILLRDDYARRSKALATAIGVIRLAVAEAKSPSLDGWRTNEGGDATKGNGTVPMKKRKVRSGFEIINAGASEAIRRIFADGEKHSSRTLFKSMETRVNNNGMKFKLERKTVSAILTLMHQAGELDRTRQKDNTTGRRVFKYRKADGK